MPTTSPPDESSTTRRRLLSVLGTTSIAGLAGCAERLPGTGPSTADTETRVDPNEITWTYPPIDGTQEGIGYTSIEFEGRMRRERLPPALQFRFNSTVGGIASNKPYKGYEADWVRFRVGPPTTYNGMQSFEMRVQPPPALKVSAQ